MHWISTISIEEQKKQVESIAKIPSTLQQRYKLLFNYFYSDILGTCNVPIIRRRYIFIVIKKFSSTNPLKDKKSFVVVKKRAKSFVKSM